MTTSHRHQTIVIAGLSIGVSTVFWTFLVMVTGWYKDPVMLNSFFAVVVFEVAGLFWGLKKLATHKITFLELALCGILMSLLAGVIIFIFSYMLTAFVFPGYFAEIQKMQRQFLTQNGASAEKIQSTIAVAQKHSTPFKEAMSGFIGSFLVGTLCSTIISLFLKPSSKK